MTGAPSFQAEAQARVVAEWKAKRTALGRAVPEWVGKSPDEAIPDRVRLRVLLCWDRQCYLSNQPIKPGSDWHIEHVISLNAGGQHREGNFRPAIIAPHKLKSADERAEAAKIAAKTKAHYGIEPNRPKMQGPKFIPAPAQRKASKPLSKPSLPPISLFQDVPHDR